MHFLTDPLISYSHLRCSEVDKFLLTYVILKLRLIKGKCIIFVNDVDRSYRVKLFLEQFSIKSCVLNSELPLNSRQVSLFSVWFRHLLLPIDIMPCKSLTREFTTTSSPLMKAAGPNRIQTMKKRLWKSRKQTKSVRLHGTMCHSH